MVSKIFYQHNKSKRAKRIRLAVFSDGSVVLTSPARVSEELVKKFITDKREWVWKKIQYFKRIERKFIPSFTKQEFLENKDRVLSSVKLRLEYFNAFYNLNFQNIYIKNQKTRWGSCSARGNLSFNYKLIFLPSELLDYVVVHEMCHLQEFNHSRKFWALVARTQPNYIYLRQQLRNFETFTK